MLETEEVDDDFFTPVSGTSLANIFGNVPKKKDQNENDSLKYVPPKPQSTAPKENDQTKSTECVFACALLAHEWCSNDYISRGKIGFAIVKIQKTGVHNIILYDSNKTTLSSTSISVLPTVTVRNNSYVCYYDSLQKYWSIYGTAEEIKKICDLLQSLGVKLNYSTYSADKGPPEPNKVEIKENMSKESPQLSIESDTDSSVNRKTKASILNRMANMGHSVLPTRTQVVESSSESSDANETVVLPKVKHKPVKAVKKNSVETVTTEPHNLTESHQSITTKTESENNVSLHNTQLLPVTSVFATNSNELGMFMTEQRINNSELRININRINDKVDSVVSKMHNLEKRGINTSVSTDILLKLLTEYETKIKTYEELLKTKGIDDNKVKVDESILSNKNKEIELLTSKLSEMQKEHEDNYLRISSLENEIKLLQDRHMYEIQNQSRKETELQLQINKLKNDLKIKSKEITVLSNSSTTVAKLNNDNIESKVKHIMNDTFQSIAMNFSNNMYYAGENIKNIVGTVMKKNTFEALGEL